MAYQYQAGGLLNGTEGGYQYQAGSLLDQPLNPSMLDPDKLWGDVEKQSGDVLVRRGDWESGYRFPKESLGDIRDSLVSEGLHAYYFENEMTDVEKGIANLSFKPTYEYDPDSGTESQVGQNVDWDKDSIEKYNQMLSSGLITEQGVKDTYEGNWFRDQAGLGDGYNAQEINYKEFEAYKRELADALEKRDKPDDFYSDADTWNRVEDRRINDATLKVNKRYGDLRNRLELANRFSFSASEAFQHKQEAIDAVGLGNLYIPTMGRDMFKLLGQSFNTAQEDFRDSFYEEIGSRNQKTQAILDRAAEARRGII